MQKSHHAGNSVPRYCCWEPACHATTLQGYSSGDPSRRGNALFLAAEMGMFGLVGTAVKAAVDLLRSR